MTASRIAQATEDAETRIRQQMDLLSGTSLASLNEIQGGAPMPAEDQTAGGLDVPDIPMTVVGGDGEAGMDWEDEQDETAFNQAVRDLIGWRYRYKYKDSRTWRQRLERLDFNWKAILPSLVDTYIRWKHSASQQPSPEHEASESGHMFQIDVLDIYTLQLNTVIQRPSTSESDATALVLAGYLGTSPVKPTLAVSLRTLELFRCLRLFKASYSIEGFAKLLCHQYRRPYRRHYRAILADTFDVYLTILRQVRNKVNAALGRDTPNWRVLNGCPACNYELLDEPDLRWARMFCLDGNNSLKRIAHVGDRQQGDMRTFDASDYYLPKEFVDSFAGEVRSNESRKQVVQVGSHVEGGMGTEDSEGDPTDGAPQNAPCTKNWKAAAPDSSKRMWAIFDEAGLFASACRHGLILWLTDMVQSGELAKYPLAMIAKALEVFDGKNLVHYDIGCSFEQTIQHSRLGAAWVNSKSRSCPNAFHGYSHSYDCQSQNHPSIIEGTGLEDGETLERIFSSSNALASVTRYASRYRRRMFIDEYFQHWDEEKYTNLSIMIYNNYVQALDILDHDARALSEAMQSACVTFDDIAQWGVEEKTYFKTLGQENLRDIFAIAYVEKLQEYRAARGGAATVNIDFLNMLPADYSSFVVPETGTADYYAQASRTQKIEAKRLYAEERQRVLLGDLVTMEARMEIKARWQPSDEEYIKTVKYIGERKYQRALDNLQRLVVQRLFELHKLNLSHTGYRMRTHIAKSLQARCKAIQNAVKAYNEAAAALDPPRPTVDWQQASHYSFLDEVAFLQDTRGDICKKPWAEPLGREILKKARRVERAREELVRCNVEARRLYTSILDEHDRFNVVQEELRVQGAPLYTAVKEQCDRRRHINLKHLERLLRLSELDGFTGDISRGVRVGSAGPSSPTPSGPQSALTLGDDAVPLVEENTREAAGRSEDMHEEMFDGQDDEMEEELGGIVDYISSLT
ncbi:hypothetical protein EVJ58_g720 [Rhodofomes roseus]|uniref:CxC1-like cysteine cluster associated with KDZ transposases domain-containing protein n=1 Tax=Rhodofomes roseus TaxID=34475 RepID=A0A4Y9Z4A5_9APHY|nr:hypothetical protein EVJ58_g720 [Rhodofomes roseus]